MLSNSGPAKLYMSIIEDVIESMRELILGEGLEDRVLDDLKQMWQSKVTQSKALENFITSSPKFMLQVPANRNVERDRKARVGMHASQNTHHFSIKKTSETLATFSLPPGLSYPVQIPAGVTLQTASGQLYKVNVPVVVTQSAAGSNPFSHTTQKFIEWRDARVPQPAAAVVPPVVNTIPSKEVAPTLLPAPLPLPPPPPPPSHPQPPEPQNTINPSQETTVIAPQQSQVPLAENLDSQVSQQNLLEMIMGGGEEPTQEPGNTGVAESTEFLDLQTESLEILARAPAGTISQDIDDILKEVIENEINKAASEKFANYPELSDIVQLDGPIDNSDIEAEDEVMLEDNEFLGMINAEAMKALQEGDGSSEGNSPSSGSDSDEVDELADVVEEDPLNSGDDVLEQDIPDLFDTDNVIVCQYDKIHRSKNRWKFHLKDGVMCYEGRDFVFSKAVGEAEW